jgi:NAD(P)-dependent dehydrogenase (short-subunit alcohol dehydrogenase family)
MNDLFDLTNKVALVTGGSRGLGLAIARAFAARGAHVAIASRKLEACEAVCAELREQHGVRALPLAYHAGRWDQAEGVLAQVETQLGPLDVLVNNAGASPPYNTLTDISEELFDKVFALNLKGPFRMSVLAAERMQQTGRRGSIMFVSSGSSMMPALGELPYAMAKSSLHNLSGTLVRTYPGVRFNVIVPGAFSTDVSKAWTDEMRQVVADQVPSRRAGEPDEIVTTALYLASDASSYTNGAVIKVDGGLAFTRG